MNIEIVPINKENLPEAVEVWNEVVDDGIAFPQEEQLDPATGAAFFAEQTFTGVAMDTDLGAVMGLYILHPNNIGRCGHICNASYAVRRNARGNGIGERLVRHCITKAGECGFRILQFNAVVATNTAALRLYEKLGFTRLGVIPKGFRMDDRFEDIVPHYIELWSASADGQGTA